MHYTLEALEGRNLFAAGTIDPSFGNGGTASLRADLLEPSQRPQTTPVQMRVDAAGRTIVTTISDGGFNLIRLTPDGTVDTRFAQATGNLIRLPAQFEGSVLPASSPKVAIDSTNRIYIYDGESLTRYTSSGKIDRTFGARGALSFSDFFFRFGATDMTIGQDGAIWMAGSYYLEQSTPMGVLRIGADGSPRNAVLEVPSAPDLTEGIGLQSTDGTSIRVLSDGSVIAVGSITRTVVTTAVTTTDTGVVAIKYLPNGRVDRGYGNNGRVSYQLAGTAAHPAEAKPVGIRGDGTVVIYNDTNASTPNNFTLTPAGRYGTIVDFGETLTAAQFVRQPDNREIVVDTVADTLIRLNADNSVDTTFNSGTPIGGVEVATIGADGSVLISSKGANQTDARYSVTRLFGSEGPAGRLVPTTLIAPSRELPFRVVFRDDDGVDAASISAQVLRIISPDGTSTRPVLTGLSESNGNVIADFVFRPADRKLTAADNGLYQVRLLADRAMDIHGNAAEARTLGAIVVRIS